MPILDGKKVSNAEALAWWLTRPDSPTKDQCVSALRRRIREEKKSAGK